VGVIARQVRIASKVSNCTEKRTSSPEKTANLLIKNGGTDKGAPAREAGFCLRRAEKRLRKCVETAERLADISWDRKTDWQRTKDQPPGERRDGGSERGVVGGCPQDSKKTRDWGI